ncbi:MAG: hypothetical protein JNN28_09185 [Saprospiraceae bacterium]|nr:hypothetical protein [Saprospiraceae bacterium]
MKSYIFTWWLLLIPVISFGQNNAALDKGVVSFVSSQNVYVKFSSTEGINKGDTLYLQGPQGVKPALLVKDKSSSSCVCSSLLPEKIKIGSEFYARRIVEKKPEKEKNRKARDTNPVAQDSSLKPPPVVIPPQQEDREEVAFKQKSKGRVSIASYSNVYDTEETHRMRYTYMYQGNNLGNSRFSTDQYITFRHTVGEWDVVKENLNNALKVYSLSVKYDIDKRSSIILGRKINQRISSMGAIDGLQVEKGLKNFFIGAIVGSRPDYADYRLNLNLFQAGVYVGRVNNNPQKRRETTFAVIEQRNHAKTDRRFAYFQHTNNLTRNLSFFGSMEADLYQVVDSQVTNAIRLTNLLFTFRYKVSKRFGISGGYDNRNNIIYYESYKSYIDQLIDDETRQGLRLGATLRITKRINMGANSSWRFQKSNYNLSKNLNVYLNVNRLPWIHSNISLSANLLQTTYLNSKIYGARLTQEIIRGKLNSELYYRMVEYDYSSYENKIKQNIAGIDLSWNITRTLGLYLYYEGTFDATKATFHRFNTRIIQRF